MNTEPPPWQSQPKFSGKFGCLIVGIGLPALLLLLLAATYMAWTARGNRRAAAALAAVREANEPVDAADLNAFYALPKGTDDVTQLWLIPMRAFEGDDYQAACEPLPIVGIEDDEQPIPPPGKPWKDLEAVEALLAKYADPMAVAHKAAERGGAARYPVDYSQGWNAMLPEIQQARGVARMLCLEARVRAHRGDWPGAARSIRDIHRLAESLKLEPCLVSQLVRFAIDGIARDTLQNLMEADDYPVEPLAALQEMFQEIDYSEGLQRALMGERAMGVSLFEDPTMLSDEIPKALVRLIPRGDDLAMYVEFMNRQVAAARLPPPDRLREFENVEADLQSALSNLGPIDKFRYLFCAMALPAVSAVANAEARSTASNQAAAAVIAAERFRRQHDRLPENLEELVPEFLAEVPTDPYIGEPMKMKIENGKVTVYSVGENRVDEQGRGERWTLFDGDGDDSDDVAFPVPPEKPEPEL